LEPPDLNELLLTIDDVPFLSLSVTVYNITRLEEAFRIKRLGICGGVFKIPGYYDWTTNT